MQKGSETSLAGKLDLLQLNRKDLLYEKRKSTLEGGDRRFPFCKEKALLISAVNQIGGQVELSKARDSKGKHRMIKG